VATTNIAGAAGLVEQHFRYGFDWGPIVPSMVVVPDVVVVSIIVVVICLSRRTRDKGDPGIISAYSDHLLSLLSIGHP
jgi:hypothetical protein